MIKRVYLDLDDTLNSFTLYVLNKLGCPIGPFDYDLFPSVGYDIVGAYNTFFPAERMTSDEFWRSVTRGMWAYAPKSPQFNAILAFADELVGLKNTYLTTAPTRCPESCAGKLVWIQEVLPPVMHRNYVISPAKHLLAAPDSLLIDDNDRYDKSFHEHGGHTILVPRPWNSGRGVSTDGALSYAFTSHLRTNRPS